MKKYLLFSIIFILFAAGSSAQFTRYIIKFTDKGFNGFSISNPSQYLSQRAIQRRLRYNIPIDSLDLPVTARYLDSVRLSGSVTLLNVSKWLNQVAIQTTDAAALAKINSFPFVISTAPIASFMNTTTRPVNKKFDGDIIIKIEDQANNEQQGINDHYNYGRSSGQVRIHNGDFLHNHGFSGEGMQMAVIDDGFYHYLSLPTFDSMRMNNQVLGTWDFVANDASVDEDDSHGMKCLSTIAANLPGFFVGTAPKTSFYLFRSEDAASEYPIEEQNWAAAAEKADSAGVDICSTSLGYNEFDDASFNYTYNDMNGNTTICARAADIAAKKGMLIVAAAGNEGNKAWRYIITPADADSVMAVGAVDTTGIIGNFSSFGPSSDGQIKPAVAAVGVNAVVANASTGFPGYSNGTSFACPNMAGITTCLWQAFPEINNMGIINALEVSASGASNPDDRIGYGIPDAKKAFVYLIKQLYTGGVTATNCNGVVQLNVKSDSSMRIIIERKFDSDNIYEIINTQQGNNNFSIKNYGFTDNVANINSGAAKYRFKMEIAADTSFYLDSINVNFPQTCGAIGNTITISPNPVSNNLNIKISTPAAAKIDIILYNSLGQKVYTSMKQQPIGTTTLTINMEKYSSGAYFIDILADGKKLLTKKIIRQ